jgi:hypothetical protein
MGTAGSGSGPRRRTDRKTGTALWTHFAKWRDDGTDQAIHDLLRWHTREKRGRLADPSLVVLDTQSVHAAAGVPADTTGWDAANYLGLDFMPGQVGQGWLMTVRPGN